MEEYGFASVMSSYLPVRVEAVNEIGAGEWPKSIRSQHFSFREPKDMSREAEMISGPYKTMKRGIFFRKR